jgi:hypothetical protein
MLRILLTIVELHAETEAEDQTCNLQTQNKHKINKILNDTALKKEAKILNFKVSL